MTRWRERQSGIALVLALATFAITITACVAVARVAAAEKLRRRMERWGTIATDLGLHAEVPILHWLEHESPRVVLPPDLFTPEVKVLHDVLSDEVTGACELEITAWDQCGMVPCERVATGSALRSLVPPSVLEVMDRASVKAGTAIGLDLWEGTGDGSPFPTGRAGIPLVFGSDNAQRPPSLSEKALALGACVATHNPSFSVNVNTAPIPLVDGALRLLGRGGLEQIIEARSHGKPATLSSDSRNARDSADDEKMPRVVAVSDAWSFRIDVRVKGFRRSWWSVYPNVGSHWRCVQRLAITS